MPKENKILDLSLEKFRWKTEGRMDLVEDLFDDGLIFIHLTGHVTTKAEWIRQLRSRQFVHTKIEQKEASVKVYGNIAVLVGKAIFTVNGGNTDLFIRKKTINGSW
ncbi:hypothetical protein Dfri01_63600 [Dyadobacter frigoris]|uniref:Nuclear transport factor 2 family protein n=1 Tax=Dyadobacter frigoris TaxID=2576211 RepID=A0A4U6CPA0_9BACT|nr:nuclear transport factor 2 family protein [Dyadobacter frigoris]GLU56899.1 hypothetical protein Dfri01_63600 [Dyadobacter frigoris]